MESPSLRTDQIADLAIYLRDKKVLNVSDPGTGKTPPVCVKQWALWDDPKKRIGSTWIMPKKLLRKNKRELLRWTGFKDDEIDILDGTPDKIKAMLIDPAPVLLMGPDRMKMIGGARFKNYKNTDVDEFHLCFGGAESARTREFYQLVRESEYATFMTGTLINGRLDTAFSAIHAIEPRYYPLGYSSFLAAHAVKDNYGNVMHWHNHGRLRDIILRHGIRRSFKDVFGDQKIVPQVQWVEVSGPLMKMYKELEELATLELEDTMISAVNPGVNLIRCRQLLDHPEAFPHPDGGTVDLLKGKLGPKYEALETHFEDHVANDEPLIVFASLVPQQKRIAELAKQCGLRVGTIFSTDSSKKSDEVDQAYQRGDLNCIVTSPPLAGVGFNWQDCGKKETNHVIFASLPYLDGDFDQARRRTIRRVRKAPLRQTVIAYDCKVENRMMAILRRKSKDAHKVQPDKEILRFE